MLKEQRTVFTVHVFDNDKTASVPGL